MQSIWLSYEWSSYAGKRYLTFYLRRKPNGEMASGLAHITGYVEMISLIANHWEARRVLLILDSMPRNYYSMAELKAHAEIICNQFKGIRLAWCNPQSKKMRVKYITGIMQNQLGCDNVQAFDDSTDAIQWLARGDDYGDD